MTPSPLPSSIPSCLKKFALNSKLRVLWNARPIVSAISPTPFTLTMPTIYTLRVTSGGYQLRKFSPDTGCDWSASLFMWHFYFRQHGSRYFHVFHQTCFLIKQSYDTCDNPFRFNSGISLRLCTWCSFEYTYPNYCFFVLLLSKLVKLASRAVISPYFFCCIRIFDIST